MNLKSVDDGVEVEDWFPIFTKNVETNIPRHVDVRMINLRVSIRVDEGRTF